jgi:acetyl esterase/lipase
LLEVDLCKSWDVAYHKNNTMKKLIRLAFVSFIINSPTFSAEVPSTIQSNASPEIQRIMAKLPAGSSHNLDVAYIEGTQKGSKPDSVQTLDLYFPFGKGPFPLVFWIHGGGWHSGGKLESGMQLALKFVPKGFALASVNYRLSGDAAFPAQIEDCNAALAFLRKHAHTYRIDSQRIGVFGHSAGAHLAALMACTGNGKRFATDLETSLRVQAAVVWAVPADLDRERGKWPMTSMMFNAEDAPLWRLFPSKRYDGEFARMASPASYVHADIPPIAMVHGQKDELVPLAQALAFAASLKKAGVHLQLRVDPERGHDVMNDQSIREAVIFFTSVLKPN